MQIHIRLYGTLRDLLPAEAKGRTTLELQDGATAAEVLAQLKLDSTSMIAINDEHESEHSQVLQDGDRLSVFMPVAGG